MRLLVRRAHNVFKDEGVLTALRKSTRYVTRAFRHTLGMYGLYDSDRYLDLLYWTNTGYGRYDALADPFKIIRIDPTRPEYVTGRGPNPGQFQWQDIGTIEGGDWDRSEERIEALPVVQALRLRFENGHSWDEIPFIHRVRNEAKAGNPVWRGCRSLENVERAIDRVETLHDRMRTEGYRSKRDLRSSDSESGSSDVYPRFEPYDEVVVDIGRDGKLLFVDGRHRLAIARILEIDEIPVRVSARHERWQAIRETVAHAKDRTAVPDSIQSHLDHPDLADVIPPER